MTQENQGGHEILPEDVIVIILGYLDISDIMVVRRCSKWFKLLTENRQLWLKFVTHPYFPPLASSPDLETCSPQALEALVRRQLELSRAWSPKNRTSPAIPIRHSYRLSMPNNEALTAMSSMNSWVAVASDLGCIYLCAPFGPNLQQHVNWIRVLSVPVMISKLCVAVWQEHGRERVAVMWAGRLNIQGSEFQCGLVTAFEEDLADASSRAQCGIILSTSDIVTVVTVPLRNPASEIMDIALGERYCAVVDAAHVFQTFMHRAVDDGPGNLDRYEFHGEIRSSRKTISIQFLPHNRLFAMSDSFIAIYKPLSFDFSAMSLAYFTRLPGSHFFGILTQHRSSTIPSTPDYMSVPLLALNSGTEITHFDLRVPSSDVEVAGISDYGLSHRRSASYLLAPWLGPFSLGTINGGHSRLVWITSGRGNPFAIAFGRLSVHSGDPGLSYQAPLSRTALDLGDYGQALVEQSPSGPIFVFHEGEGKLLGSVRGMSELFMLEY